MSIQRLLLIALLGFALLGCAQNNENTSSDAVQNDESATSSAVPASPADNEPTAQGDARVVRLVTHESFDASEALLAAFEDANNARIEIVPLGDAGSMVNQSILSKNNPLGDLLFGVDNSFLARALDADLFEPYASPALDTVDAAFQLDPEQRVTPIDYGDVCLNYDIGWFEAKGLPAPDSLDSLIDPAYKGLTVAMNPASSSPGLAFLLTTVEAKGEEGWQAYWQALRDNDLLVTSGWSEAYFDHFTAGGGDGDRPIVVSYASSPPFTEGATASVTTDGSCFRQIEFAGVLANAKEPELAKALIDFMLSPEFQADVPEKMFVFPVVEGIALPDAFAQWAQIPANPVSPDPQFIEANRDRLIEAWTDVVVR
ncbi:MAG: thiamine ABC transporter substrate-binding protein [Anaerolineales bacterium]|nr:thiamine ABC transporter substrate-binding protein [Anaerolineales bacterium]